MDTNKVDSEFTNHNWQSAGLEICTGPLAQASVKTTWASTNPRLFVAFI